MANYIFKETQRFNQIWLWLLIASVTGLTFYGLLSSTKSFELIQLAPLAVIGLVFLLFLSLRLETRIDYHSLSYSFFPFIGKRKFDFETIESMDFKVYNSLWEYGGWGIRYNFEYWTYNTGGRFGIMVKTKDKRFLIGTQQPEEAKKAIAMFEEYKLENHGS